MRKILAVVAAAMLITAQPAVAASGNIWSGWWSEGDTAHPLVYGVSATWVQPAATCNKPNSHGVHDEYASWVGLGQGALGPKEWLVQIGVITSCGSIGGPNQPTYQVFWEAVDNTVAAKDVMPPQTDGTFVHAGDQLFAKVTADGNGNWMLRLEANGTIVKRVPFTPTPAQKAKSTAELVDFTAEAISESRRTLQQWPNFGALRFSNIQVAVDANQATWVPFSSLGLHTSDAPTLSGKPATKTSAVDATTNSFITTYLTPS